MRGGLALAPLTLALLLASDIEADQHSPLALLTYSHFEFVTVATGANAVREQVVQVIINHAGHIAAVVPHPLIVLRLHVDRDVLDVVLQGRPSDSLHRRSPRSFQQSSHTWRMRSPQVPQRQHLKIMLGTPGSRSSRYQLRGRRWLPLLPPQSFCLSFPLAPSPG